jgi:hypothetical protein
MFAVDLFQANIIVISSSLGFSLFSKINLKKVIKPYFEMMLCLNYFKIQLSLGCYHHGISGINQIF